MSDMTFEVSSSAEAAVAIAGLKAQNLRAGPPPSRLAQKGHRVKVFGVEPDQRAKVRGLMRDLATGFTEVDPNPGVDA